jgi:hypothetical protein
MKPLFSPRTLATLMALTPTLPLLAGHVLSNGPGDGGVTLEVDSYGAFGGFVGPDSGNAIYDPVGPIEPAGTIHASGVAVRIAGGSAARQFLTTGSIGTSGSLPATPITGDSRAATSAFSYGGLEFTLNQSLDDLYSGTSRAGARLNQEYTIFNPGSEPVTLQLIRFVDGDLRFDGSLADGGGRQFLSGVEVLFETDSATGEADSTTFVGITGEGGIIPADGRYEISSFGQLRTRVIFGNALRDVVDGDGDDPDQFVDPGHGYDIAMALMNLFEIPGGGSAVYTTRTIFGTGAPQDAPLVVVPEAGTVFAGASMGLLALGVWSRRRFSRA